MGTSCRFARRTEGAVDTLGDSFTYPLIARTVTVRSCAHRARNNRKPLAISPLTLGGTGGGTVRYRTRIATLARLRLRTGDFIGQFYSQFFSVPSRTCACILLATVQRSQQ